MSEKGQEYIPFGEEWEKSMMRMSKAAIVRMYLVKYREAYRLTKYQLDAALNEIKELKEKLNK